MSDTKMYIVTMKGCCLKGIKQEKVGAKVKLTDAKAKAMAGKVQLLKDYEKPSPSEQELIKANAKLAKRVKQLESLGESNEVLDKLMADGEALEAEGKHLADENAKLAKQIEELTAQLDEATKPPKKDK